MMAKIPVSNTYAKALAPNITLPGMSLTGMPEHISLFTDNQSIPQIDPTGMLDFTPISIDESGWNPPTAGPSITGYVKDYWEKINNPDPPPDASLEIWQKPGWDYREYKQPHLFPNPKPKYKATGWDSSLDWYKGLLTPRQQLAGFKNISSGKRVGDLSGY
tara:strand:+ start:26 stop:508 length:483 start_codon:yes stop_codon:yes gene_type:complete